MRVELSTKLNTVTSTQLIQYAGLLHMNNCELLSFVQSQLEENPILESVQPVQSLPNRVVWQGAHTHSPQERNYDGEKDLSDWFPDKIKEESLYDHVHEQLLGSSHDKKHIAVAEYLAQCLNDSGYLEESCEEIAGRLGLETTLVYEGLEVLQSLAPAGIGARDLQDCLLLQLRRTADVPEYAEEIITGHLQDLAASRYRNISRDLGANIHAVYEACNFVKSLDPKPAAHFSNGDKINYIVPDAAVLSTPDGFEIVMNDSWIPSLKLSPYYVELMKTGEPEVKQYLTEKYGQARVAIHNIEQRRNTLILCIQEIVETQKTFFLGQQSNLAPLSQSELALRLSLNESTLSRAIHGKYILCAHGVYPLSFFFSRSTFSAGEESKSQTYIISKIKSIIDSENPASPLSDQKIVQMMEAEGIDIARRTVSKYRVEMNIPTAAERKARALCGQSVKNCKEAGSPV